MKILNGKNTLVKFSTFLTHVFPMHPFYPFLPLSTPFLPPVNIRKPSRGRERLHWEQMGHSKGFAR